MYFFTREEAGTACFIRTKCAPLLLRFCVLYRAYPLPQKDKTRKENPFRVQTPIPQKDTTPKRKKDIPRIFSGYYPYTKGVSLRRASLIFSYPEKIRDFSPDTTPYLFGILPRIFSRILPRKDTTPIPRRASPGTPPG